MFDIFIKRAGTLTADESAQANEADSLAYSAPDGGLAVEDINHIDWADPFWYVLGRLDGRIVSMVGVLTRKIRVGQQVITVAGVGGVATHPDYQRRGLAGQLMQRAADFMRDELRVPFALLVCSDLRVHYYAKFGWQLIGSQMRFDYQGKKRTFKDNVMVLSLAGESWPEGTVDLCGNPW